MADPEILGPNDELTMVPVSTSELDPQTRSEINMQVQFAMDHPRKMEKVLSEIESLSCLNQEVAEEMFYTLKRKDATGATKLIQGPSIRFAEILIYCYRNTRGDKGISNIEAEYVTGKGVFFDLERNNAMKVDTKRRITNKDGKRYGTDMIQTTGNAASSLAFRNAVTAIIPQALWKPKLKKAMAVAIGGTQSIAEKRTAALDYGKKIGVSEEQIFATLGVQGINDLGLDELIALKGLFNTLKDGESTIEDAFGDPFEKEINGLMDQLGWNKGRRDAVLPSYRGRSADLIAYLRKQVEPLNAGQPAIDKPVAEQAAVKEEAPATKSRRVKKDPPLTQESLIETKTEPAEQVAETQTEAPAEEVKEEAPKQEPKQATSVAEKYKF